METDKIEIGNGMTKVLLSDRHAYTIIDISKNGKMLTLQRDRVTRINFKNVYDSQEHVFELDPNGEIVKVSLRKNDIWREVGGTSKFIPGRNEYYDYSF